MKCTFLVNICIFLAFFLHRVLKCRTFGAFNLLTLKVAPDTDLGKRNEKIFCT